MRQLLHQHDPPGLEIDIAPTQPKKLAPPHSCHERRIEQGVQPVLTMNNKKPPCLLQRPRQLLRARRRQRRQRRGNRIVHQETGRHGVAERHRQDLANQPDRRRSKTRPTTLPRPRQAFEHLGCQVVESDRTDQRHDVPLHRPPILMQRRHLNSGRLRTKPHVDEIHLEQHPGTDAPCCRFGLVSHGPLGGERRYTHRLLEPNGEDIGDRVIGRLADRRPARRRGLGGCPAPTGVGPVGGRGVLDGPPPVGQLSRLPTRRCPSVDRHGQLRSA